MGCCLNSHRHEVIAQRTRGGGRGESSPQSERPLEPRVDMMEENKNRLRLDMDTTVELRLLIGAVSNRQSQWEAGVSF